MFRINEITNLSPGRALNKNEGPTHPGGFSIGAICSTAQPLLAELRHARVYLFVSVCAPVRGAKPQNRKYARKKKKNTKQHKQTNTKQSCEEYRAP